MNLPRARHDDLLATDLQDEVVVYDPQRKQAHSLNRVALAVWNHADGTKTVEDLQRVVAEDIGMPIDQAAVVVALRKLERAHLLLDKLAIAGPMTRREALQKAGRYGAAVAVATPIIASALVPVAAAAASVCVGPNSPGSTAGATCGATCQCLITMTPTGPGSPACVETNLNTITNCGTPVPGGPYVPCPAGTICIQLDGSRNLGLCFAACPTPTCSC
jgi:coenzyme PQQ synthesis protein D (PqqD)